MSAYSLTMSPNQSDLTERARAFAEREIRPVAWEYDTDGSWPQEIIDKAWEQGLMNAVLPAEYGGPAHNFQELCLIAEEFGWGCAGIGASLLANGLGSMPLLLGGTESLKRTYLARLTEAPRLASFCLTEADAGSDASAIATNARRKGQRWVIGGTKCLITNASHADWYTVFARTDGQAGTRGMSAFVVPREAGVSVEGKADLLGQRASDTATISFHDAEVPLDHLIGEQGQGFSLAMRSLDRTRTGVAALATGVARAAMEFAIDHASARVQFGKPLVANQAIQMIIADMSTKIHLARLAARHSAELLDRDEPNTLASSHAKRFAADTAMEVTTDAVQVLGGYGLLKGHPTEKLMRDAKPFQIYEGTAQIQRLVIARETVREHAAQRSQQASPR
jgi:acyl-CoA dehydrogenase